MNDSNITFDPCTKTKIGIMRAYGHVIRGAKDQFSKEEKKSEFFYPLISCVQKTPKIYIYSTFKF
jgi:hypothetical protein